MKGSMIHKAYLLVLLGVFAGLAASVLAEPPVMSNLRAAQRTDGSKFVDVYYDVADSDSTQVVISVKFSDDNGVTYNIIPKTLFGDIGLVTPGTGKQLIWDSGKDVPGIYNTQYGVMVTTDDNTVNETLTIPLPGFSTTVKQLEMVRIPAGKFMMGSPDSETDRGTDEGPQFSVTFSKDFYLGKYEVTKAQWNHIMGITPAGNDYAVTGVSWDQCQEFIKRLNQLGKGTFRLPTEAEWEYACRAGTMTRYFFGDDNGYWSDSGYIAPNTKIKEYAWFNGNSQSSVHEVGSLLPNAWGLFDMSGNVWEWCQDWYVAYTSSAKTDPTGASTGSYRVYRGGSWAVVPQDCRSAKRYYNSPSYSDASYYGPGSIGLRLLRSYP